MMTEEMMKELMMLASRADLARLPADQKMRIHSEALKVVQALGEYKEVTSMLVLVSGTDDKGHHTANMAVVGLPTCLMFGMDYLTMNHREVMKKAGACPCPMHKMQLMLSLMETIADLETRGEEAQTIVRPM